MMTQNRIKIKIKIVLTLAAMVMVIGGLEAAPVNGTEAGLLSALTALKDYVIRIGNNPVLWSCLFGIISSCFNCVSIGGVNEKNGAL